MANVLFLTHDWSQLANVVIHSGGIGADASKMLSLDPRQHWFADSNTAAYYQFSRTVNTPMMDTIYTAYTHLGPNGTWRIRGWTPPQDINSNEFDTGVLTFHSNADLENFDFIHAIHRLPAPVSVTNIQVDLTDDGSSAQPIQVGIFRAAKAFVPTRNVSRDGYAIGPSNDSQLLETFGSTPKVDVRPSYHTLELNLERQTAEDAHEFFKLAQWYSNRIPVVVALDHDGEWMDHRSDGMVYALLDFGPEPIRASSSGMFKERDITITGREFI